MNYMATFGSFQVKILVTKRGYTARRWSSVDHCLGDHVIKISDGCMLQIPDLGAVVDMVLAVMAMFCDRFRFLFARRRDYLKFHSDPKYPFHLSRIHK
jgi:hypothetical protein